MKDFNLEKEIYNSFKRAERENKNNIYLLKSDIIKKVKFIECLLRETEHRICFDIVTNSVNIFVLGYVFDSSALELKQTFRAVDFFVINALNNGLVCMEMKISNVAEIIGRV